MKNYTLHSNAIIVIDALAVLGTGLICGGDGKLGTTAARNNTNSYRKDAGG